jgi:hypothetical protein
LSPRLSKETDDEEANEEELEEVGQQEAARTAENPEACQQPQRVVPAQLARGSRGDLQKKVEASEPQPVTGRGWQFWIALSRPRPQGIYSRARAVREPPRHGCGCSGPRVYTLGYFLPPLQGLRFDEVGNPRREPVKGKTFHRGRGGTQRSQRQRARRAVPLRMATDRARTADSSGAKCGPRNDSVRVGRLRDAQGRNNSQRTRRHTETAEKANSRNPR